MNSVYSKNMQVYNCIIAGIMDLETSLNENHVYLQEFIKLGLDKTWWIR